MKSRDMKDGLSAAFTDALPPSPHTIEGLVHQRIREHEMRDRIVDSRARHPHPAK